MTSWGQEEWGAFLSFVVGVLFFGYLAWAFPRRRRAKSDCVRDGPADEIYRAYTRNHDRIVRSREVIDLLAEESPDRWQGWSLRSPEIWRTKVDKARAIVANDFHEDASAAMRATLLGRDQVPSDIAICLLIDHSGSMRDEPILHTAAAVRWLSDRLRHTGIPLSVLGFSTIGWQGGKAYQDWRSQGQPKRPGRLCALLHIEYQAFDEPLACQDWEAMVHPDVLRENVDGEAILWACEHLRSRHEKHKLLIVLSDGAPVDDRTLEHNGPSYLWRHIKSVIADVEASHDIILAAIGLNHQVDDFYLRSLSVNDLQQIPDALSKLIVATIDELPRTS